MSLDVLFQHSFNAPALGSLYGLITIGYTMVRGILRLINFVHGDILVLGAYFVFCGTMTFLLPWGVAVVVAILVASTVGILADRVAYRPLRDAPRISAFINAIAVSFFIESSSVVTFSGLPRPVYRPKQLMTPVSFGWLRLLPITLVVPVVNFVFVLGFLWIIHRTKPGLVIRAVFKDIETTRLLEIWADHVIVLVFGFSSALAAISGIIWVPRYLRVDPYMGIFPSFKAFTTAMLGDIGSIQGAMIDGLLLGFIEIMTVAFIPSPPGYHDVFAFVVLVLVLLVRPTGLFRQHSEEEI